MLTLGLAGGLDPVHEARLDSPDNYTYDGAAVLVEDGAVVAAVEESRVDRIRRSNKFPSAGIRTCLEQRGAAPEDLAAGQDGDRAAIRDVLFAAATMSRL